jgi:hypothetical protein
MYITKKVGVVVLSLTLFAGAVVGVILTDNTGQSVSAHEETATNAAVDTDTLTQLYDAAFGRPLDDGAKFHIGKDIKTVLRDINYSPERRYYAALFKAVKSYEEALRAPGTMSDADKKAYLDAIDSALATLIAWVETLPEKPICDAVISPERAREAIKEAYDGMNPTAKVAAERGIFNASANIGKPGNLTLPVKRCIRPAGSPTPGVSATPMYTPI